MANSHFPEVKGFGSVNLDWPAMPDRHTVPEVAAHYLKHRVGVFLRERGITSADLSQRLGDTDSAWRSRLNGTRRLDIEDLVGLCLLVPDLAGHVIPGSSNVDDWLPASYAGLASGRVDGTAIPVFRGPADVDWGTASEAVSRWWSAAVTDGTAQWSFDDRVLIHEIIKTLDEAGLSRRFACPAGPGSAIEGVDPPRTSSLRIDWVLPDVSATVMWLDPFDVPTSARVRELLATIARALWSDRGSAVSVDTLVIAAPHPVIGTLNEMVRTTSRSGEQSVVLSIADAHRLGLSEPAVSSDIQVAALNRATEPLLWLLLKS